MTKRRQPIELLLDLPEPEALFRFEEYSSVLTNAIINSEPRFKIGIFGPWGKGKTTLLNKIQQQLEKHETNVLVVPFDAWRYQHESHMVLPMLETLEESLNRKKGIFQSLGEVIGKLAKAFAVGTTLKAGFAELSLKDSLNEHQAEAKSLYYQWHSELNIAMNAVLKQGKNARIVFLVDDLDRCLPNKAVEVLEAIKVFLDTEGFVFVLALDKEVIVNAVEAHYGKEYPISGGDYIKKLIQVEFALPTLRSEDIQEFVKVLQQKLTRLDNDTADALQEVMPEIAKDNPREVKRFINNTLITNAIAVEAGLEIPPRAQVAFMGMKFRWPGFIEQIMEQIGLVDSIKRYLSGDETGNPDAMNVIKTMIEKYPGLERFLRSSTGGGFLELPSAHLSQLIYFAEVVEESEPINLQEQEEDKVTSPRFAKFSERARTVLDFAQEEARNFNHHYIGTEHILLGLVREQDCVAAKVLVNLGVQLNKVRSAVEFIIGHGEKSSIGEIALTPRSLKVIELAVDEAKKLQRSYISTEHLLIGILREGDGVAAGVLESLGVSLDRARAETIRLMSSQPA
ncbi:MAG: AAA family ATPase [Chloroflexi bacterium]|nr:AAA family ATPase [Chloroflexota bacterium]